MEQSNKSPSKRNTKAYIIKLPIAGDKEKILKVAGKKSKKPHNVKRNKDERHQTSHQNQSMSEDSGVTSLKYWKKVSLGFYSHLSEMEA